MGVQHSQFKTLIMLLLWNICLSSNVVRNKRKFPDFDLNDYVDSFDPNLNLDNVYIRVKKSSNITKSLEDDYVLVNDSKEKMENRSDDFGKIVKEEEYDTTVIYDSDNATCVGEEIHCNYSLEQYMDMLNEYIYPNSYEWVLIATHAMVFVIGLTGNALVCIAVYRNHSMRTVTNYFIVNLAVADFMVILICLPPTVLWDVSKTWFFGTAMCKIVLYFQVRLLKLFFMILEGKEQADHLMVNHRRSYTSASPGVRMHFSSFRKIR